MKEAEYIRKIESLEVEVLNIKASKNMLQSRLQTYERSLSIKGGEFAVYLKKMIQGNDLDEESRNKISEVMKLFQSGGEKKE